MAVSSRILRRMSYTASVNLPSFLESVSEMKKPPMSKRAAKKLKQRKAKAKLLAARMWEQIKTETRYRCHSRPGRMGPRIELEALERGR